MATSAASPPSCHQLRLEASARKKADQAMITFKALLTGLVTTTAAALISATAHAATCSIPSTPDQGDAFAMWDASGWMCSQTFINYWWDAYDFDSDDWDGGFGYENPCDNARPLARTFNGLYSLGYSSTGSPSCSTSQSNITLWAQCWSASQIDELDGRCGSGTTNTGDAALTHRGVDDWTELYWPFFYGMTISVRGASIFHEARHAWGCGHNGGSSCLRGGSCDFSYGSGCTEGTMQGSNTYEVNYIAWYLNTAWRTTQGLKDAALARANDVLARGYVFDPCFRLSSNGTAVSVC